MPHRIDAQKIADGQVAREAIKAAITRLQQIETLMAGAPTTAQTRTAIKDLATYVRHIIRVMT
jgi:hypothetical protein